jgi:hypothetical protein
VDGDRCAGAKESCEAENTGQQDCKVAQENSRSNKTKGFLIRRILRFSGIMPFPSSTSFNTVRRV